MIKLFVNGFENIIEPIIYFINMSIEKQAFKLG